MLCPMDLAVMMTAVEKTASRAKESLVPHCFRSATHCLTLLILLASNATAENPEANWSAFQNGGHPIVADGSLPTTWSPENNIAWKASIEGYGQSSPVVGGDQVYVTSVSGAKRESYHLTAYSLLSGEKIWQRDFDNPTPLENTPMTSRAAPTSVAEAGGCIAFLEGGLVVSVDREGMVRWQRNLIEEYGAVDARHGLSASLERDDQRVYLWVERGNDPYILALDKESGENIWKVEGVGATSWSSPRLVPTADGNHLVCSASGKIVGIDPATGNRLWEFTDVANNTSCTPVPVGQGRFLIGASEGRGEETSGPGAPNNGVVEIKRSGDQHAVSYLWQAKKASSSFGSPIVAGGHACFVNRAGVLYRLDIETGEPVATDRTSAGGIWATPIVSGDRLYLFGYKGTTSVISLSDGREIATNRLWPSAPGGSQFGGAVLYAAAAAPPYLILRRGDMLFAVKADD
jgi:outer membrane protein assembly factor BamB